MLEMLNKRLDDILEMAEEAEKHCDDNETKRKEINAQIEAQKQEVETSSKYVYFALQCYIHIIVVDVDTNKINGRSVNELLSKAGHSNLAFGLCLTWGEERE